ncbi:MAG TPA: DUF2939 domain-containing protein [Acetobacteraceae bacterium]|nr:DUF2939 domain-containing protein [Acetobacteraceae bacterium]
MTARVPILTALGLMVAGYVAYPCLTLYRLNQAINNGDSATLSQLVDWPSVREGIAEEIADTVTDAPSPPLTAAGAQLAPFGHGFLRGVAAHAMRGSVTPQALIARLSAPGDGAGAIRLAYFTDWSRFIVKLGTAGGTAEGTAGAQPGLRLQLDLQQGIWRVTRIELPPAMLHAAMTTPPAEIITAKFPSG